MLIDSIPSGLAQSSANSTNIQFFMCESGTFSTGFGITTIGSLYSNGVGVSDAEVQFSYRVLGETTWQGLENDTTSYDGGFSFSWTPTISTNYVVNVTWAGNSAYSGVTAIGNYTTTAFSNNQNQYVISTFSNSTITGLTFDPNTNEEKFSLNGPSGTTGYCQVCIPKVFFTDFQNVHVILDGTISNYDYESDGNDYYSIDFACNSTIHAVVIALGPTSTSSPTQSPSPSPNPTNVPTSTPTQSPITQSTPTPTPNIPEFILKFVDESYNVPTTYTIDPYTGQNVTNQGSHVYNIIFEMVIQNQQLTPYYNIQVKGHFGEDWEDFFLLSDGYPIQNSSSQETVIKLGTLDQGGGLTLDSGSLMINIPAGGQEDFQVEALIGSFGRNASLPLAPWIFIGTNSGWSDIQTITVPVNSISSSTSPTPAVPELSWLAIIPLMVSMLSFSVILRYRKTASFS